MTFSVRDLAGQIGGDREAAAHMAAGIAAARSSVAELLDAYRAAGVEGGASYQSLVATGERLELAERLRAEVEGSLEKARFIAMSAITGLHAGGGGAKVPLSPAAVDDPASWEKPVAGGELAQADPGLRRRGEGLANFFGRNTEGVEDVAKTVGKQIDIAWHSVGHEPTPTSGVITSSEVPTGPVFQPPPAQKPSSGSVLLAGFALAAVTTKAKQKASEAIKKSRKAEE